MFYDENNITFGGYIMTKSIVKKILAIVVIIILVILFIAQAILNLIALHKETINKSEYQNAISYVIRTQEMLKQFDHQQLTHFVQEYNTMTRSALAIKLFDQKPLENIKTLNFEQALKMFERRNYVKSVLYLPKSHRWAMLQFIPQKSKINLILLSVLALEILTSLLLIFMVIFYGRHIVTDALYNARKDSAKRKKPFFMRKSAIQLQNQMESLIAERTLLLSTLFHDIKTPMTRALLYLQIIPKSTDEHQRIAAELMQMNEILNSTIQYYQNNLDHSEVNLSNLLTKLYQISCQHIRLIYQPETITTPLIPGNEGLLYRALSNIVFNALKYATTCYLNVEQTHETTTITIYDFGPGVPEKKLLQLFQPHVKNLHQGEKSEGHGLGLAIAKKIIELHHGNIFAKNLHSGLEFTITLPNKKIQLGGKHD